MLLCQPIMLYHSTGVTVFSVAMQFKQTSLRVVFLDMFFCFLVVVFVVSFCFIVVDVFCFCFVVVVSFFFPRTPFISW